MVATCSISSCSSPRFIYIVFNPLVLQFVYFLAKVLSFLCKAIFTSLQRYVTSQQGSVYFLAKVLQITHKPTLVQTKCVKTLNFLTILSLFPIYFIIFAPEFIKFRTCSSVGQSNRLIIWRSLVQAQAGPQIGFKRTSNNTSFQPSKQG